MNKLSGTLVSGISRTARTRRQCRLLPSVRHYTDVPSSSNVSKPPSQEEVDKRSRLYLQKLQEDGGFPDLMEPDVLMDLHDSATFPPSRFTPYENKVVIRNDPSMFLALKEKLGETQEKHPDAEEHERDSEPDPLNFLHIGSRDIANKLYQYPLVSRRVVQQTGKGKVARIHYMMVAGDMNGLVGVGEGKATDGAHAMHQALVEAVRNMDYIERFEDRTVWTEMENKFASTRVIIRPRPVGFGLHVNPHIYHILKAAGIRDASAKVWGSRNPMMVVRATMQMLMPGNAPMGMGNGVGGKGRRLDKRVGMRSPDDIARDRGRKMVPLRTW
ncbi:hypothetical protein BKA93DRAFT_789685 [Sparassis latifolia]